jgi:uncharacterized membrane protein
MRYNRSHSNNYKPTSLANGLGWFSIGLGLVELIAPGQLARLVGMRARSDVVRSLGVREILNGIGILTTRQPARWQWARVGGDLLDLAVLGAGMVSGQVERRRVAAAAAVAGVTVLDMLCASQLGAERPARRREPIRIRYTMTIDKPAEELYQFWREVENLPRLMPHLREVRDLGNGRSHWEAKGPAGTCIRWNSEITTDRPNSLIAWRSVEDSDLKSRGEVLFEPARGGRGTVVTVKMDYDLPAGQLGKAVAWLTGKSPDLHVRLTLVRFKQLMETGEIATRQSHREQEPEARIQDNRPRQPVRDQQA